MAKCTNPVAIREFEDFILTGIASLEFLEHFDNCDRCQKATEEIAERQGRELKKLLRVALLRVRGEP